MSLPHRNLKALSWSACILGCALLVQGCGNRGPARVELVYVDGSDTVTNVTRSYTDDGFLLEEFDIDGDGAPDSWTWSHPLTEEETPFDAEDYLNIKAQNVPKKRLIIRKLDINSDGIIDVVRYYDEDGELARDELDSDLNGNTDRIIYYREGRITRRQVDADADGVFEENRLYVDSKLYRVERDTNGDGQVDFWMFFENGKLDRAGVDLDADGVIDRWLMSSELLKEEEELDESDLEDRMDALDTL